jgi:hypothetical protein
MPGYAVVDAAVLYYSRYVDLSASLQNIGNRRNYFVGSVTTLSFTRETRSPCWSAPA